MLNPCNLVKIWRPVNEISCKQESVTPTPTPTGYAPKTICPPPFRWGGHNEEFVQLLYAWWRTTRTQTFIKKVLSKYLQWDSNKDLRYFHFSLISHSNGNKKHTFCGGWCYEHLCEVSASTLLSLLMIWFLNIFSWIPFGCHGNQSNSAVWTKLISLVEDYSRNISVNFLSKYLLWDSNKGLFSLFPL